MVSPLTDSESDLELKWIEAEFRAVFDKAKLSHGWRFMVECQRRWNLAANGLRPVVAVVLENTALPEDHRKRRFAVKTSLTQKVRSRAELKPLVMEVLKRCLEAGMAEGLREAGFDGKNQIVLP